MPLSLGRQPPPPARSLRWTAAEVVRDLWHEPHLLLRVRLSGVAFPHRDAEPFVQVGGTRSRFVRIAEDSLTADAYFDRQPKDGGTVEFGYGHRVHALSARRFAVARIKRLQRDRLPPGTRREMRQPDRGR